MNKAHEIPRSRSLMKSKKLVRGTVYDTGARPDFARFFDTYLRSLDIKGLFKP